jgi:hypothetical protein
MNNIQTLVAVDRIAQFLTELVVHAEPSVPVKFAKTVAMHQ